MCVIREMTEKDFKTVIRIIKQHDTDDAKAAANYFQRYLKRNNDEKVHHRNFVAIVDDKVVGVSGFDKDEEAKGIYWLSWMYVLPCYQRRGIGSKLLAAVEDEVRRFGTRKLYVDTSSYPTYQGAVKFYKKKGLEVEAILKDYYQNGENQLLLSKEEQDG